MGIMEGKVNKFYFLILIVASFSAAVAQPLIPPPPPGEPEPILSVSQYLDYVALIAVFFGMYILYHHRKNKTL
ncbi:hypothetical protein KBJ98_02325 [Flavobacterium sp. F-328]|uniref:Signal peptidase n=1 Tax=Flavobacterium erciyesense TaxID=2825842 RepID=A0ABS5D0I2_9FLAO|nr:hypothetical protein [Flavobacterium erciyesense]MBQ0907533.1 hypothetical protein [Flavobacterium erciyesense]